MSFPDEPLTPDPEPPPPAGSEPERSRPARPVLLGLAVAVVAAVSGAAIAHVAWPSSSAAPTSSGIAPFQLPPPSQNATPSASSASTTSIANHVSPALVDINTTLNNFGQAAGTGMVVTANGSVITNNHVITGATHITATDVGNGRTYSARVVGYDRADDVAVLQLVGASGLKTVTLGSSRSVKVGQAIVTIGNAGGVGGTPTAASGTVTALGQSIQAADDVAQTVETLHNLIQIDGQLQPGDSGGPLVDRSGTVVGLDTAASSSFSFQTSSGAGFAIPIDRVRQLVNEIVAGRASKTIHIGATPLLGVEVDTFGFNNGVAGAPVADVVAGGPADSVGIAGGDTITALGGHRVTSASSLVATKDLYHPGNRVPVTWVDVNGASHTATITLSTGAPD